MNKEGFVWKLLPILFYILPNFLLIRIYNKPFADLYFYVKDRQIKKRLSKMTPKQIAAEVAKYNYESIFDENDYVIDNKE